MYNRVNVTAATIDTQAAYTYTSATARQAGGSSGNGIIFVYGQTEDGIMTTYAFGCRLTAVVGSGFLVGMTLDSPTNTWESMNGQNVVNQVAQVATFAGTLTCPYPSTNAGAPSLLGLHTLMAIENSDGSNANTFNSANVNTLSGQFRM